MQKQHVIYKEIFLQRDKIDIRFESVKIDPDKIREGFFQEIDSQYEFYQM